MPVDPRFTVAQAASPSDIDAARSLMLDYARRLGVDLCFQGFEAELSALPGAYAPPRGALLLARDAIGRAIGCVALRPLPDDGVCEMKRLYVTPDGRGLGLGRALVEAMLRRAADCGYREMRLDTLPSMHAAQALYRTVGFEEMPAYYQTPIPGTVYLRRRLTP
ncbi:MAG: GNAT family N-acetyltransferase [Proteobacteria bacterium]|nr:GNAT family N-acetyltransferase [Pseudomonadota bacterium]